MKHGPDFDAVVIGAGFSGLGMLRRLRDVMGLSVQVYETGSGVGGTWYWNRYPGARCDSESYIYCFSFSKELLQDWTWSGKYPEQPEILSYLEHVADRFDLRRNIQFDTRITAATFHEETNLWEITTDRGDRVTAQYLITAIGCISTSNVPPIEGLDSFQGDWYHTGAWPHDPVDFSGKRVGVIGTGSSGVQSIPVIARQARSLTVFQRTPQFTVPARHRAADRQFIEEEVKPNYEEILEQARWSQGGGGRAPIEQSALAVTEAERNRIYEEQWEKGGYEFSGGSFADLMTDRAANDTAADFIRDKIRQTVKDPETCQKLLPHDHPFGAKRGLLDTGYYATYNRDNVHLVDLRRTPIRRITPTGIRTSERDFQLDVIVFATGFDAMTGTFFKIDIRGRNGLALRRKWSEGPKTYLGLQVAGFPNMFMITGPGSPSVLSNMPVSIEQHIDFIADFISWMRERNVVTAEADPQAEEAWVAHVNEVANTTLYVHANSWYLGANIPGKPRVFMPYPGGVGPYRQKCNQIANDGYEGFILSPAATTRPAIGSAR